MTDPNLFQLTEEDKAHYNKLIKKIDLTSRNEIVQIIGPKIVSMMDDGALNAIEVNLINDVSDLLGILELYPDLRPITVKRILFAISYFCDADDEIPDIIPNYGYLDDAAVVHWVVDQVKGELPDITRA